MRKWIQRHGLAVSLLILAAAAALLLTADFILAPAQLPLRVIGVLVMLTSGIAVLKLSSARIGGVSVSRQRDWSRKGGSVDQEPDPAVFAEPGTAA